MANAAQRRCASQSAHTADCAKRPGAGLGSAARPAKPGLELPASPQPQGEPLLSVPSAAIRCAEARRANPRGARRRCLAPLSVATARQLQAAIGHGHARQVANP